MDCVMQPRSYELNDFVIHSSQPSRVSPTCPKVLYEGPSMSCFWGGAKVRNGGMSLVVIGHRGCGKNLQQSLEISLRPSVMENTLTSFNAAAVHGADFVEFDVQVTKDGYPVLFHDDMVVALVKGEYVMKTVSELSLSEFLSFGYQKLACKMDTQLLRKGVDGSLSAWTVSIEDSFCTLEEAFELVSPSVGFNIELKFASLEIDPDVFNRAVDATLQVVNRWAGSRKIFFSSFHPDAALILRRKQKTYPVFFLTDGGTKLNLDPRKNSIEAAIEVCIEGGLQGIVCQVKALLQNAVAVKQMQGAGLCVLTYGELNNLAESLIQQEEAGVDGVIVDHVAEMVMVAHSRNGSAERLVETGAQSSLDWPLVNGFEPLTVSVQVPLRSPA